MGVKTVYKPEELRFKFLYKDISSAINVTRTLDISYNQLYVLLTLIVDSPRKFYEFYGSKFERKEFMNSLREEVNILTEKGYVYGHWTSSQDYPEGIMLNSEIRDFILTMYGTNLTSYKSTVKKEDEMEKLYMKWAHEFVIAYPSNRLVDGMPRKTLKDCKHPNVFIWTLDDLKKRYIAEINRDEDLHRSILSALKVFKNGEKHHLLNKEIVNFVVQHDWNTLIMDAIGLKEEKTWN